MTKTATKKDDMSLMLYPINVNDDLQIEDYDHLYQEAVDIKERYEGYIGNAKQCRAMKSKVNKLMKGLNNVRKAKVKPHRKQQKYFKSQIDTLIKIVGTVKQNMNKQLDMYNKDREDKLRQRLQPDMDEICRNNGLKRMPVPDEAVTKKSMSKKKRLDLMIGTAQKKADKIRIANARVLHGKAVDIASTGEIKPLPHVKVERMTFIGDEFQLYNLRNYIKKQGLNVKED